MTLAVRTLCIPANPAVEVIDLFSHPSLLSVEVGDRDMGVSATRSRPRNGLEERDLSCSKL